MESHQCNMEELPEEIIAKIFNYLSDPITASQVCMFFKLVATSQTRAIHIKLSNEKSERIKFLSESLKSFHAMKKLKLELSLDVNNVEKSKFCNQFRDRLTHLVLREMTFLNPYFNHQPATSFDNLATLTIVDSDLCSCSDGISNFILKCCPNLKDLTISGCSGLEIESLNHIGQNLHQTKIENFHLLPTYSYFDVASSDVNHWTIDNLKTFSIRSKLVVMKKNFVQNLIGRRNEKLRTLELIAEIDLGESLAARIIENYPSLEKISLSSGCSVMKNEDFSNLCNFYRHLKSFEFHFSDGPLDLSHLRKNESIGELTLGLTKNVNHTDVASIAKCLPHVIRLNIILYYFSTSNQKFLTFITKIFPRVTYLAFQRTGMSETMKFTAIQEEIINAPNSNLRHFDDIRNLTN